MKTYITYGSRKYDPAKFDPIKNRKDLVWLNKPFGGLWAADVDTDTWINFCKENSFSRRKYNKRNSFKFQIVPTARILKIDSEKTASNIIKKYSRKLKKSNREDINIFNKYSLDFEKIMKDYDVIDYVDSECQSKFPFWDVDCILVLNKNVVRPL